MFLLSLCLFVLSVSSEVQLSTMNWVSLKEYPEALCNDGSAAGYYFSSGSNKAKWVIYLEGTASHNTLFKTRWWLLFQHGKLFYP
jgi:hypothetical protein